MNGGERFRSYHFYKEACSTTHCKGWTPHVIYKPCPQHGIMYPGDLPRGSKYPTVKVSNLVHNIIKGIVSWDLRP